LILMHQEFLLTVLEDIGFIKKMILEYKKRKRLQIGSVFFSVFMW